jgi:hypothetical protein
MLIKLIMTGAEIEANGHAEAGATFGDDHGNVAGNAASPSVMDRSQGWGHEREAGVKVMGTERGARLKVEW